MPGRPVAGQERRAAVHTLEQGRKTGLLSLAKLRSLERCSPAAADRAGNIL